MKLTLTLDEVSAVTQALLSKAQEAEEEALGCEKLRCAAAAEFWKKRAELYRKTFEAVSDIPTAIESLQCLVNSCL